jgi:transcription elongation factor GreB
MADEKNYITPQGHAALEAEFQALLKVERPALVKVVSWAASNGDRSENGDYIYGKRRLRQIDSRLRFLMQRMDAAVIVDPATQQGWGQLVCSQKRQRTSLPHRRQG